jgi:hypothetical protein
MSNDVEQPLGVVVKCGVCLALLILLAVIGSADEQDWTSQEVHGSAQPSASVAHGSSAAAHRKELFDSRRAKFSGNASGRGFAVRPLAAHADAAAP